MVLGDARLVSLVKMINRIAMPAPQRQRCRRLPVIYPERLILKALVIVTVRHVKEGQVPRMNYTQVGLRGYCPDEETVDRMQQEGFRYHAMAEVERRRWDAVSKGITR